MDQVVLRRFERVRSNQNAEICVSTLPLSGMPDAEHVIERRDAIGGDDEQPVAELVDVADLSRPVGLAAVERGVGTGAASCGKGFLVLERRRILQGRGIADNNHIYRAV